MIDKTTAKDVNETILFHLKFTEYIKKYFNEIRGLLAEECDELDLIIVFF